MPTPGISESVVAQHVGQSVTKADGTTVRNNRVSNEGILLTLNSFVPADYDEVDLSYGGNGGGPNDLSLAVFKLLGTTQVTINLFYSPPGTLIKATRS